MTTQTIDSFFGSPVGMGQVIVGGQGRSMWLPKGQRPPDPQPGWMWQSVKDQVRKKNGGTEIWLLWQEIPMSQVIEPYPVYYPVGPSYPVGWPGRPPRRRRPHRPHRPRRPHGGHHGMGTPVKNGNIRGMDQLTVVTQAAIAREIKNDPTMLPFIQNLLSQSDPKRRVHVAVREALVNELDPTMYPQMAGRFMLVRQAFRKNLKRIAMKRMVGMGQVPGTPTYATRSGMRTTRPMTSHPVYAESDLTMGKIPGSGTFMTRKGSRRFARMVRNPYYGESDLTLGEQEESMLTLGAFAPSDLTLGYAPSDLTLGYAESDLTLGADVYGPTLLPTTTTTSKGEQVKAEAEKTVENILKKAESESKTDSGKSAWDSIASVATSLFDAAKPLLQNVLEKNFSTKAKEEVSKTATSASSTGQVNQAVTAKTQQMTAEQLEKMRKAELASQYEEQKKVQQQEGVSKTTMIIAGATIAAAAIPVVAKKF